MERIETVAIDKLESHPRNPRLFYRDDVLDSIVAQLQETGDFSEMYAPIVRPVNDHYEIVSGHHRVEAARRVGMPAIPCWVKDMTVEEAYMQLVLSNAQGELSPLEIGIHVLGAVENAAGGAGKIGGLSEYARLVGKTNQYIGQVKAAAEVFIVTKNLKLEFEVFQDKAKHLAAIHKADESLWPMLVECMLASEWSAADATHWTDRVREFDIPSRWGEIFLPLVDVVQRFLDTHEFSPVTVQKLGEAADRIMTIIESYEGLLNVDEYREEFKHWLQEKQAGESWDLRQLVKYQKSLLLALDKAEDDAMRRWNCGDWHDFIADLDDGSVSLLLTDPPYGMGYQSDYKLDRRAERNYAAIAGDNDQMGANLLEMLQAMIPKLSEDAHVLIFTSWKTEEGTRAAIAESGLLVRGSLVWVKNNTGMGDPTTTFAPQHERIIHAVKGSPTLFHRESDVLMADRVQTFRHPTEKPLDLLERLIEATTVEGELVVDPFGGVASTLVAAKHKNRDYWGCEIEKGFHQIGAERLYDE